MFLHKIKNIKVLKISICIVKVGLKFEGRKQISEIASFPSKAPQAVKREECAHLASMAEYEPVKVMEMNLNIRF